MEAMKGLDKMDGGEVEACIDHVRMGIPGW
jgi:hypothetical protein